MRVAALYDVHGNLPALEAVLAEVERDRVDADAAVARIRRTGYPEAEQLARWLLEPEDPHEVSEYFEGLRRGA